MGWSAPSCEDALLLRRDVLCTITRDLALLTKKKNHEMLKLASRLEFKVKREGYINNRNS